MTIDLEVVEETQPDGSKKPTAVRCSRCKKILLDADKVHQVKRNKETGRIESVPFLCIGHLQSCKG